MNFPELFQTNARGDGSQYQVISDNLPEDIQTLIRDWVRECHDGGSTLPNDIIFCLCADIASTVISAADEMDELTLENFEDLYESLLDTIYESIDNDTITYYRLNKWIGNGDGATAIDSYLDDFGDYLLKGESIYSLFKEAYRYKQRTCAAVFPLKELIELLSEVTDSE